MQDLTPQEKMKILDELKKKQGIIDEQQIPMVPVPMTEMTPEKAAELDALGRNPSSAVEDISIPMQASPMESYSPAGSYVGGKLGQQVSPDMLGTEPTINPVPQDPRLAKLKALFQKR